MEQYIPYSLICDLFSRNVESFTLHSVDEDADQQNLSLQDDSSLATDASGVQHLSNNHNALTVPSPEMLLPEKSSGATNYILSIKMLISKMYHF